MMDYKKFACAVALSAAPMVAFATPEVNLDYLNESLDPTTGTVNNASHPVNAAMDTGWYIWATQDYSKLYLAWSDLTGGEYYSSQITAAFGLDSAATISVENGGLFVDGPSLGIGTVKVLNEWVVAGVDVVELTFDPEIQLGQDIEFWLSTTGEDVDSCADFGITATGTDCVGQFADAKNINIWDAAAGDWKTDFTVEMQMFDHAGTDYFSQNFQVTRVSEPATLAMFGLGLAGLGMARRKQAKA